jgi:flagellar motor switch protein FliG
MGMLTRYKKDGGFETLLMLIEQCNKKKQDQLIGLVENEDLVWAERIRAKMLTQERVLALPQDAINEIFSRIPEKVLVFALAGTPADKKDAILATFTHFKKKAIDEMMTGTKPTPGQTEAAFLAIFKKIRDLEKDRTLNLLKFAPALSLKEEKKAA